VDESNAPVEQDDATPIFSSYRRGYDPEQVDRFVADQRRRLDEAIHRASEAERRLAAAVGQLRELHRRVTLLESEDRATSPQPQPPSLDTLGERVQRILQEAWEGAYAVRQTVEQEVAELKDRAAISAEEIVATSRRKSEAIEEEIERRRRGYLERVERDRARAIAQMTYLSDQRQLAIQELLQVKTRIESAVGEIAKSPSRTDISTDVMVQDAPSEDLEDSSNVHAIGSPTAQFEESATTHFESSEPDRDIDLDTGHLEATMPLHRLRFSEPAPPSDASSLVSSHRSTVMSSLLHEGGATMRANEQPHASVFDFDEAQ
jgi:hypothetical protein